MQSMAHNEYVRSLDMVTTARKYMRHSLDLDSLDRHHSLDYICQKSVRIEEKMGENENQTYFEKFEG